MMARRPGVSDPAFAAWPAVEIVLDLSHLLSRVVRGSPSGIDRIELAYARTLKALVPDQLRYAALHPSGSYGRLDAGDVEAFLDRTEACWETRGGSASVLQAPLSRLAQYWGLRPRGVPRANGPRIFLQVSPDHLDTPLAMRRKLHREAARFVCLVHDPARGAHPEFTAAGRRQRLASRWQTIGTLADGIVVSSHAALDTLIHRTGRDLRQRPHRVARLGVDAPATGWTAQPSHAPYFLCVATIEPRCNHQLLLNIWRSMAEAVGPNQAPRLLLVGRRGWQHHAVVDMIRRCPALQGVVQEIPRVAEAELRGLRQGACALLMPAFADDCGLALAEALAAGVPVLASDIAVHRETGGTIPEYLDPIDGAGWRNAILAYQAPASPRRMMQLERISHWRPVSWRDHVETALSLIREVAAC